MIATILAVIMASRGVPTFTIDSTVYVEDRPGCTVRALQWDPGNPVIDCRR